MTVPAVDPDAAILEIAIKFDHAAEFDASQRSVDELEIPNWLDAPDDRERLLDPDGEGERFIYWELMLRRRPTDHEFTTFADLLRSLPGQANLRLGLTEAQTTGITQPSGLLYVRTVDKKPGRNDPCLCGTGVKYKRCCGS
jgi:hypothetical protein